MLQASEQRGMAAMTDATIVSTVAAIKSARCDNDRVIETSIPSRLDGLRWSGFHTRVVTALGITWILDGLEVTLAGALSGALKESSTLHFTNFDVGFSNSAYLAGAVLGALVGAISAIVLLDPAVIGPDLGWRLAYLTGACLGLVVFVMRMWIPESPRWLMIHGYPERAHAIVDDIERSVIGNAQDPSQHALPKIKLKMRHHTPLREVARTLFFAYRQRSLVGLALMIAQAFFYNAIFFTFALVLTDFYGRSE